MPSNEVRFGRFRLDPERRLLFKAQRPVRLGNRALDILIALVERAGEVVAKPTLTALTWPGLHVDESNLRAQVAALRRALGDGRDGTRTIINIAGRGYCFVAPLDCPEMEPPRRQATIPARQTPIFGFAPIAATLAETLRERRFVTIFGAGGIGKTTMAIAVAEVLAGQFSDPPCFVDFGVLTDGALALNHVAAAIGAPFQPGWQPATLAAFLAGREMLVVLDSCEPVADAAAAIAEAIMQAAPRVHLLATSRERLRATGECVYRLASLGIPPPGTALTAASAMEFPAIRLFVERARAAWRGFRLLDADVPRAADICRRLDGIPLAIELAAPRVAELGLCEMAERLDDRFGLLTMARHGAVPRHATLRAMLDWSFQLLSLAEQAALGRLAVFRGGFSQEAALAVARQPGEQSKDILGILADLTDKSLLVVESSAAETCYRCLDTTRAYLAEMLAERGEAVAAARAHAAYYLALFEAAEQAWRMEAPNDAPRRLGSHIDNLRAALDWAFGPEGAATTGIALTIAAVPLWSHLALVEEGSRRVQTALAVLGPDAAADPRRGMQLFAALGHMALQMAGPGQEAAWTSALALAEQLGDDDHRLRALSGLCTVTARRRDSLTFARQYQALAAARGRHLEMAKADRMAGYAHHMLGDQMAARQHLEGMLRRHARPVDRRHLMRFNFDEHVLARSNLAMVLWLQGDPQDALRCASHAVREAQQLDHEHSIFFAVAFAACPIAIMLGGLERLPEARDLLFGGISQSPPRALWGICYRGLDQAVSGDPAAGLALLREGMARMTPASFGRRFALFRTGVAECLLALGEAAEAAALVDEAIKDFDSRDEHWFDPEFFRLRAAALDAMKAPAAVVEAELRRSLALARQQAAIAWELRSATSLARLLCAGARQMEAVELLGSAVGRFAANAESPDLDAARQLLLQAATSNAEPRTWRPVLAVVDCGIATQATADDLAIGLASTPTSIDP